MGSVIDVVSGHSDEERTEHIVSTLTGAFADLMDSDPDAFRRKFRKMAAEPFAFYRGSACLFYSDVARDDDPYADEHTARVWIQGDLHAENFGTYMNAEGILVFDVNDFDEAYLGHFTWDVKRFAASIALLCWAKAISDDDITHLIEGYARAYLDQVRVFAETEDDDFALTLDNADGPVRDVLLEARLATRVGLLDAITVVDDVERRFRDGTGVRRLGDEERAEVEDAFRRYLDTIPETKRFRSLTYRVKDVVGRSGFGIGSAGLPAYNVLVEGRTQALENDVVLSMKQGNVPAPSRVVDDERTTRYFAHQGERTAVSQRALQAHADPWLGHTTVAGVGFVVSELSPYDSDLDWDVLSEPEHMAPVVAALGRATAKAHCVSDTDSDQTLVGFQTEEVILRAIGEDVDRFVATMVDFGTRYAAVCRTDHRLFVDAFRGGRIPGL